MQEAVIERIKEPKYKKLMEPQSRSPILVVDDEETIGVGMTEILKDAGFDAEYALDGFDAVEKVKKKPYTLVFMDMIMPGMNGLETYRKIREIRRDARVLLFTGFFKDAEKIISQGVGEGMIDEFLRKPFFAEEIINVARKYA
jgi:CheY-like chemotaxis protein